MKKNVVEGISANIDSEERTFKTKKGTNFTWSGKLNKDENPEGQGKAVYEKGDIYEGNLINGRRSGKGKYKWKNGNKYNGEWKDDLKDGFGVFENIKTKEKYEGIFLKGYRRKGKTFYKNGDVYDGYWGKHDKHRGVFPQGRGKIIYAVTSEWDKKKEYDGEWKNGRKHGKGKMLYVNGDKYNGHWYYDRKNGFGRMDYKNGNKYFGEWANDENKGSGIMIYKNGDIYDGKWKYSEEYGLGKRSDGKGGKYNTCNGKQIHKENK